jgi:EmrB/QacA subfamily drug resistance transporter
LGVIILDGHSVAKTWVLVAAILGSAMTFIDGSAVNVTLPILQRDFAASAAAVQWVVEGYALFLAALILLGGSLGDIFGRKRMFVAGVGVFALASLVCGIAPRIELLIAARCIQGVGAALMVPESLALISANFTGIERGRAIGTWSAFASITAAGGPILGGYLAGHFSWRWVFFINLPLALAVVVICLLRVPDSRDESAPHHVDLWGSALATLALGAITYGCIRSQGGTFDVVAGATIALGCALAAAFVWVEGRAPAPMLPLRLFGSRTFSAANLYTLLLYGAIGGSLYFVPFVLIDVQRYAPSAAGAAFLPFILLQFSLARWSGGLIARFGARAPLVGGALLAGLGFAAFALPGEGGTYWTTYFPAVVLLGLGGVLFVAPLTTTVFDAVSTAESGVASGVNNAVSRTAGLLAIALFGIVLAGAFSARFDRELAGAHFSTRTTAVVHDARGQLFAGGVPAGLDLHDRPLVAALVRASYLAGFRAVMAGSAVLCVLAAVIAVLGIPGRLPAR